MGTMAEGTAARKVIIIGAGFAGLAAARRVAFRGAGRWQAIVLEGSHRVGGRAHTAEVSSHPVRGVSAPLPVTLPVLTLQTPDRSCRALAVLRWVQRGFTGCMATRCTIMQWTRASCRHMLLRKASRCL